jgi:hypothetical protein
LCPECAQSSAYPRTLRARALQPAAQLAAASVGSLAFATSGGFTDSYYPEAPSQGSSHDADDAAPVDSNPFRAIYAGLAAMVLLLAVAAWWWARGADVHVTITPAEAVVTLDGKPLTMDHGEAFLPALNRGPHMLVVKPLGGGTLDHALDVGFFDTTRNVQVTVPDAVLGYGHRRSSRR